MATKRKKEIATTPLQQYLDAHNIKTIHDIPIQGIFYGKRPAGSSHFRYVGPLYANDVPTCLPGETWVYVSVSFSLSQERPDDDDDDQYWGFYRFDSSRLVSIYRGYQKARSVWENPDRLESVGVFVRVDVYENCTRKSC